LHHHERISFRDFRLVTVCRHFLRFIMPIEIDHPRKIVVPLDVGKSWGCDGAYYFWKLDGKFATLPIGGGVLCGENIAGLFVAWDCVHIDGADCRMEPLTARLQHMRALCVCFGIPQVESSMDGGKLLAEVLEAGGEGVCRKTPDSNYYATMQCAKRIQTWHCRIVALDMARGSATVADAVTGEARGICPLRNRVLQCRVGSLIKVEGLELTAKGLIRQPRPCQDSETSWLVTF
jgi:hypothetical protein